MAAAAFPVATGREVKLVKGAEDELNACVRSREKKSVAREVSERIPPRK